MGESVLFRWVDLLLSSSAGRFFDVPAKYLDILERSLDYCKTRLAFTNHGVVGILTPSVTDLMSLNSIKE